MAEIRDIAPGLWVWTRAHPGWTPESDFEGPVTFTCVTSGGEVVLLDPLAPEPDDGEAWARLDQAPRSEVAAIEPGSSIPGGLQALYDGRGRNETPVWIAEHRTLVFADALAAPRGELLVWDCPALQERALPALRALLELPFERVIVSHGDPVHDRAEYERALTRPAWSGR